MPLPNKKNFLRDVLPKKSISDVSGNVVLEKNKSKENSEDVVYYRSDDPIVEYVDDSQKGRWRIWLLAIFVVLVLTVSAFYVFSKAEVTITQRTDEVAFNDIFKARKAGPSVLTSDELSFSVFSSEKIGSKNVESDGEKNLERKATGTIIIYNKYSANTQKLIKNTRFETSDGLIYRIDRSVIVPGRTVVDGKIIPGSVEATIYADEPGIKYNIPITDFSIPGFKSDSGRYSGFYARSKGPIIDGFSGKTKYVSDSKQKLVRAEIRGDLEKKIIEDTRTSLSKGSFVPKNAYVVEFESLPTENGDKGTVLIKEKAKIDIFVFDEKKWDNFLAKHSSFSTAIGSSTLELLNRDDLDFAWQVRPKTDSVEISFRVSGNAKFIWLVDEQKIKSVLAGQTKQNSQEMFKKFGEIVKAEFALAPFWRTEFPTDLNKIKIIKKNL